MRNTLTAEEMKDLIYGEVAESLVFIPRKQAEELASVWVALGASSTWGEFRARVSTQRFDEFVGLAGDFEDDSGAGAPPPDDELFPGTDAGVVCDGDYPEWPAQEMLEWMPQSVLESRYADVDDSIHNGEYLILDPSAEEQILALLRAEGFNTTKDPALVSRAAGYVT